MQATVEVSRLTPALAAQLLVGIEARDPSGRLQRDELPLCTQRAECFVATSQDGRSQVVYTIRVENGVAWVDFAKGHGDLDWIAILGPVVELQAKGVRRVAFQTSRPGLVRKARKQGYSVRGWIVGKDMQ